MVHINEAAYCHLREGNKIMQLQMAKGTMQHLEACCDILEKSELGAHYFKDLGKREKAIKTAISSDNLHVSMLDNRCVGFLWFIPNGAFFSFPYLHMIVVKEEHRSCGIGSFMLQYFEECTKTYASKVFLNVDSFNPKAKSLYERLGYQCVGTIPNAYINGIDEDIMMKVTK